MGIATGCCCCGLMANRCRLCCRFHKWKIQTDLINLQEGCLSWGPALMRQERSIQKPPVPLMYGPWWKSGCWPNFIPNDRTNKPDRSINNEGSQQSLQKDLILTSNYKNKHCSSIYKQKWHQGSDIMLMKYKFPGCRFHLCAGFSHRENTSDLPVSKTIPMWPVGNTATVESPELF